MTPQRHLMVKFHETLIELFLAPTNERPAMDSFSAAMRKAMRDSQSTREDAVEHTSSRHLSSLGEAMRRASILVRRVLMKLRLCEPAGVASDPGNSAQSTTRTS
jgi:hypothetical protein